MDTLSLTSEASSMPIDNDLDEALNNPDIEMITQELANHGPPVCEKQIRYVRLKSVLIRIRKKFFFRYLFEIFLAADCYDWSFLLALVLKSQTMIIQVMNAIRVQDLSAHTFTLQRGLLELETWVDSQWFAEFFWKKSNFVVCFSSFQVRVTELYCISFVIKLNY